MTKMDDYKRALDVVEDHMRRLHGICPFRSTANPDVACSTLPSHWRSNKSLPHQFSVLIFYPIADGTKVSVTAGNEENSLADIKNNTTEVQSQIAKFSDLRFVGKSGRGKNFNLTITIHTKPMKEVTIVTNVIKVTVDGPRDSRNPNNKIMGDGRKRPGDPLHYVPSFLPLKQQRLMPPFPLLPPSIAPGHFQAALSVAQSANPLQPPLSQLLSLPAICESYKAVMMGAGRQTPNFPPANFLQTDPALMQQLGTMMWLKDLISTTNLNNKLDSQKSPQQTTQKNQKQEKRSSTPLLLPASSQLPSPCFQTRIKDEISTSSDESGSGSSRSFAKIKSPDLQSPNETYSTTASTHLSISREDEPIDVEGGTTDDDEHCNGC
ncbi:hypothetical protein M3Y97_00447400 [Aphelenchoides bicaudatus]|nr:hypothetical protein M3Y97_00447400 [Aphelenchoides bicaudatus]